MRLYWCSPNRHIRSQTTSWTLWDVSVSSSKLKDSLLLSLCSTGSLTCPQWLRNILSNIQACCCLQLCISAYEAELQNHRIIFFSDFEYGPQIHTSEKTSQKQNNAEIVNVWCIFMAHFKGFWCLFFIEVAAILNANSAFSFHIIRNLVCSFQHFLICGR